MLQLSQLSFVVVIVCAALCRNSQAYSTSTNSVPVHQHRKLSGQHDTLGRRSFFHQYSILSAAMLSTITTSPQPANAASKNSKDSLPWILQGSPAPAFNLLNSRGEITTLDTLTNNKKWTVMYFYPGAFTTGCTLEARNFQAELPNFQALNTQVVGVSVDSVAKNAEFCSSEKLDFFMLTDEDGSVSKSYGSSLSIPLVGTFSNRQTYIIDPEKNVRWIFVDVESRIQQHANDVLEKLKELQQV